jgi:hypothetical protein
MVEKDESFHTRSVGEVKCGLIVRMAPVLPLIDFLRRVLGVMNEDVRILAESDIIVRGSPGPGILSQFIVCNEHKGFVPLTETKPQSSLGVVKRYAVNHRTIDFQRALVNPFKVLDLGLQVVERDGEKTVAHLVIEGIPQSLHAGGESVNPYAASPVVDWGEEGKTENVIPVDMGHEEVNIQILCFGCEFLSKRPDAGPCVNDHDPAAFKGKFKARRISTIHRRMLSWYCDRSSRTPKSYSHDALPLSGTVRPSTLFDIDSLNRRCLNQLRECQNLRDPVVSVNSKSLACMIGFLASACPGLRRRVLELLLTVACLSVTPTAFAASPQGGPYLSVPGLIDIRSTFSDGSHGIEELVQMARSRGFKVLFISDHERIALTYGIPPFRRIMRYRKHFPSIMTHGPEKFIEEIGRVSRGYPDTLVIPGCITSPYYYWTGSYFGHDLTAHEYDRRIIAVNLNDAEDYRSIPDVGNELSLRYTGQLLPGLAIFIIPLAIGLLLLKWKGRTRLIGIFVAFLSALAILDYNPFRGSLFDPYSGNQGIAPFQTLIDYVSERNGLSFWNYPEQLSGSRTYGPIRVSTPPYPQVLHQSRDYTGFAAIYGDRITVTEPGREWDRVLNEYCRGERSKPAWGISTADFHEDGRLGLKLGAFPTVFLVKQFTKSAIVDAMSKGRMYCARDNGHGWPRLDEFNVLGKGAEKAFMGETLNTQNFPVIRFKVSHSSEAPKRMTVLLIRGGNLVQTFEDETPFEVVYEDRGAPAGTMTYYRLMDADKHLASNPIFVRYEPRAIE